MIYAADNIRDKHNYNWCLMLWPHEFTDETIAEMRGKWIDELIVPEGMEEQAKEFAKNLKGMYVGNTMRGIIETFKLD
jgi:hypothetical protein